jgi:hypothetical protein
MLYIVYAVKVKILARKKHQRPLIKVKRRTEEKLKPEEQEGMPQHQHCLLAKRRGDRNAKHHEF